jgi:hypothetical protein
MAAGAKLLPGVEIGDVDPVGALIGLVGLVLTVYLGLRSRGRNEIPSDPHTRPRRLRDRNSPIALVTVVAVLTAIGVIWALSTGDDPSNPAPTASPVQASVLGGCRGAANLTHAPVSANPCISVVDGHLELASHVTALQPGKVTVFVWLTNGNVSVIGPGRRARQRGATEARGLPAAARP